MSNPGANSGLPHGVFDPPRPAARLSIYMGEADRAGGLPLYEAIVLKCRELHIAGATVLRGPMGFGAHSRIHTAKVLRLSQDLPIVIQIVDTADKISELLPHLKGMMTGGLVTVEDVRVAIYSPPPAGS